MKYYRRNPGDYLSATGHLTLVEHGAYNVLMDTYYATENALPCDPRALYRIAGAHDARERAAVDKVCREFFTPDGDELIQGRIETEIAAGREKSVKLAGNGSKGAEARTRNKEAKEQAIAQAIAKQKPRHIHQPSTISKPEGLPKTSAASLLPDVENQVVADWERLRKGKKAAVTKTAVDGIRTEAAKAGLSMQQALETCCQRGWAGFKAEWLRAGVNSTGPPRAESEWERKQRENRQIMESIGGKNGSDNGADGKTIDGTAERVD